MPRVIHRGVGSDDRGGFGSRANLPKRAVLLKTWNDQKRAVPFYKSTIEFVFLDVLLSTSVFRVIFWEPTLMDVAVRCFSFRRRTGTPCRLFHPRSTGSNESHRRICPSGYLNTLQSTSKKISKHLRNRALKETSLVTVALCQPKSYRLSYAQRPSLHMTDFLQTVIIEVEVYPFHVVELEIIPHYDIR